MTAKRRGLGRGLGALIPTGPELDERASAAGESDGADSMLGGSVATVVEERPAPDLAPTDDASVNSASADAIAEQAAEQVTEKKSAPKNTGPRPSTVKWDSA